MYGVFYRDSHPVRTLRGASQAEVAAGLCRSIVRNYLHKVVSQACRKRVVLQGGVATIPGSWPPFSRKWGAAHSFTLFPHQRRLWSGPAGAGVSPRARPASTDLTQRPGRTTPPGQGWRENIAFTSGRGRCCWRGMTPIRVPGKDGGRPLCAGDPQILPHGKCIFRNLGFNVLLSPPTNEEIIRLAQQTAQAETCYPVKLLHGHMAWLAEQGVDYIFMPSVHTMKHESSHVEHNYGCVYMQTAPRLAANALDLERRGNHPAQPGVRPGLWTGGNGLRHAGRREAAGNTKAALSARPAIRGQGGAAAYRGGGEAGAGTAGVPQTGRQGAGTHYPELRLSDPVLNMGIPRRLLERGHKVITLSHLPAHDLDLSEDYPNLYWPFGQLHPVGPSSWPIIQTCMPSI